MIQKKLQLILSELERALGDIDPAESDSAAKYICCSPQIFVAGVGRTGYMMRAFAMRLMQSGFKAYVVGDTETPRASKGDLLIVGSGSGETESLIAIAKKSKRMGLNLCVITGFAESPLGKLADMRIRVPGSTPKAERKGGFQSAQPMGSLLEQAILLCLDALIMEIMELKGIDETAMFGRHANLE